MVSYLKVNILFKYSMVEARMLTKLGGLSAEDIDFYLWWSILAEKLAINLTMYLVTDIATGAKGSTISNTLNLILTLWYLSCNFLHLLSTEVKIFLYSGTSWDCEGMSYSPHICWYRFYAYILTPVGSCTLLMWLTLLL